MRNNNGITLISLVITIIIILILAGIGIGTMTGMQENIKQAKTTVSMSDLTRIQQVVLETYVKYKQTGNRRLFNKGIKVSYATAEEILNSFNDNTLTLKLEQSYDENEDPDPSIVYYKVEGWHLQELGIENIGTNEEYIVNYSTGEVFDAKGHKTAKGEPLYICTE